jgi:hypothetical protein
MRDGVGPCTAVSAATRPRHPPSSRVSLAHTTGDRLASGWGRIEPWVGTRRSAVVLFAVGLCVYAVESVALPVYAGRDMARYVQAFLQLGYGEPVLPAVVATRGPLAALGVGVPLSIGGVFVAMWLAVLYSASIVAWAAAARAFGAAAAVVASALLLLFPGYSILFHELASDSLFAAGFAGWALLLTRAVLRPSRRAFLVLGIVMGLLVLIRPGNQVLLVFTLFPLVLPAPPSRRLQWAAVFYLGSTLTTEGWDAIVRLRFGDAVSVSPNRLLVAGALVLIPFAFEGPWRRRLAFGVLAVFASAVLVQGLRGTNPIDEVRAASAPSARPFLFRAFTSRLVLPENGKESKILAGAVRRELLSAEPYKSYGVDVDEFFRLGGLRAFDDLASLDGPYDLGVVAREALTRHPGEFASGIVETIWQELWSLRLYPYLGRPRDGGPSDDSGADTTIPKGLRPPTEGELIPGSRDVPDIHTLWGGLSATWSDAAVQTLVFDDPRDARRWAAFNRDTERLYLRIHSWDAHDRLVHRLEQASHVYPPPLFWLVLGVLGVAVRRPRHALAALAPSLAAAVVVVATASVTFAVIQYALPVAPAFIFLAAVGLAGRRSRAPATASGLATQR